MDHKCPVLCKGKRVLFCNFYRQADTRTDARARYFSSPIPGHRNEALQNIAELSVLLVRKVEEGLINLLLDNIPIPVSDLDPDVIVSVIRRLSVSLLVLPVKHVALDEEKHAGGTVADRDDCPWDVVPMQCVLA